MLSGRSRALGLPRSCPAAHPATAAPGSGAWGTPVCHESHRGAWPQGSPSAFGGTRACFLGVKMQWGISWLCQSISFSQGVMEGGTQSRPGEK